MTNPIGPEARIIHIRKGSRASSRGVPLGASNPEVADASVSSPPPDRGPALPGSGAKALEEPRFGSWAAVREPTKGAGPKRVQPRTKSQHHARPADQTVARTTSPRVSSFHMKRRPPPIAQ